MNTQRIQKILKGAEWPAVILAGIVAFAAIAYAAFSVGHLFSVYVKISLLESGLAVVSSVGMAVGLLLVIVTTDNQNARGLGSILLIAWVLLVLSMVALDSVMRAALVQSPAALQQIGRIVAALLPALALAGVVGMVIALHDKTNHKSAAGASSRYVSFAAKGVSIGASSFAAFYFGSSRGIDPVLAALCAALLESSFLWSYLALKNSRDRGDRFDVGMWSVCVFLFGAFITLVSIETLSSLGKIEVPIVTAFGEIGATLYVSAVGLTVALTVIVHLLTRAIDDMPKQTDGTPFAIRTADTIRNTRAGFGEIKAALRGPAKTNPALPAGTTLSAKSVPGGAEWQVTEDGQPVASGKAESLDAAKASANSAAGSWLGKFVFVFNGESDYDEGGAIKSRADELLGEIGMRVKHGSPIGLEFWMFDKESFTSALKLVNGQPMQVSIGALTAQCSVTGFTRAADGSVTHAEVAADVFWDVAKANMTDAEARRLLDGAIHKQDDELNPKTSENGVKYGTTGSVVDAPAKGWPTPEELAAHRKWVEDNAKKSPRQ